MKKRRGRSKQLHFSSGSAKKAPQGSTITAFFVHLLRSVVVPVMVNLSGGEQRAILYHSFCNKGGNRARRIIHTVQRFKDTVGDWLIGFEIVLFFFFRIEDSLPSFFRFGETVACMIRSILYEAILPPG